MSRSLLPAPFPALPALAAVCVLAVVPLARADWPEFRGPTQDGQVPAEWKLPLEWSEASGVTWKTAIPGRAWSTPVISGGKVWMTSASEDGREMSVVCVAADSGKLLHDKLLFRNATPEPLGNAVNSYGSPSPAIEQDRVYLHFGSYGTACLDTETAEVLWERRDLPCRHYRGPGSSLILHGELLILTMDGVDVQYLAALDKRTGKTVWKTDRTTEWDDLGPDGKPISEGDLRKAYTTPLVVRLGATEQLVSTGAKATYGYDPATGKELWNVTYPGFSNAASPVFADGMAILNTGYGKANLFAVPIIAQSRGDLTGSVMWKATKRVPQRSSTIVAGAHLFMVSDNGFASCLRLKDGEEMWSERVDGSFSGSPIAHQGRLYFASEEGTTYVIAAKPEFELLARNTLEEGMLASPAAVDGALFLRTKGHLYRISAP